MAQRVLELADVDLSDPDRFVAGEPWEEFALLQREAPCHWNPEAPPGRGFWSITRYRDVVALSKDTATFSNELGGVTLEDVDDEQMAVRRNFLELDPPRHTAVRQLLAKDFTPRALSRYEDLCRAIARHAIDEAAADDELDFVERIAAPVPIRVLGHIMGVPDEHHARLIELSDRMISNQDPEIASITADSPESEAYRLAPFRSPDAAELCELGRALYAARREEPQQDVMTIFAHAEIDGCPMSPQSLDNNFVMMIVAGNETTRQAMALGMLALIEHPDQLELLRRDPSLMPAAVEELIRWSSPVYHFRRTAARETELHGETIRAGDKVVLWFAAANRDPDAFPEPFRLDVSRKPNDHAAFGRGGPHFCLGAHLARLEIRVVLEELLPRLASIELAGSPARVRSNFANGVKRMPVRITWRGSA